MYKAVLFSATLLLLQACGADPKPQTDPLNAIDTVLRLPVIESGMAVDTSLAAIRISAVMPRKESLRSLEVMIDDSLMTGVVNIYADSIIPSRLVDSVINVYCAGKDLRLIGINNGQELAIPFHGLHRFPAHNDTVLANEWDYHLLFVDEQKVSVNDWPGAIVDLENYYRSFYGDAFNPDDSIRFFPQRQSNHVTVESLILEGQAWDNTDMNRSADTAAMLAAYNEFVNKLEIYDKAGSFFTLRAAVMDVDVSTDVVWSRLLHVFSVHFAVQQSLKQAAKKFLADKIANEGGTQVKEFTDEDLRLLYPDRLRWNGRISGVHEHRYDPVQLAEWGWLASPPLAVP